MPRLLTFGVEKLDLASVLASVLLAGPQHLLAFGDAMMPKQPELQKKLVSRIPKPWRRKVRLTLSQEEALLSVKS